MPQFSLDDIEAYAPAPTGRRPPTTVDFATQGRVDAQPPAGLSIDAIESVEAPPPSDEIDPPAGTGLIDAKLGQVKSGLST
jgi:hypothetical protein